MVTKDFMTAALGIGQVMGHMPEGLDPDRVTLTESEAEFAANSANTLDYKRGREQEFRNRVRDRLQFHGIMGGKTGGNDFRQALSYSSLNHSSFLSGVLEEEISNLRSELNEHKEHEELVDELQDQISQAAPGSKITLTAEQAEMLREHNITVTQVPLMGMGLLGSMPIGYIYVVDHDQLKRFLEEEQSTTEHLEAEIVSLASAREVLNDPNLPKDTNGNIDYSNLDPLAREKVVRAQTLLMLHDNEAGVSDFIKNLPSDLQRIAEEEKAIHDAKGDHAHDTAAAHDHEAHDGHTHAQAIPGITFRAP